VPTATSVLKTTALFINLSPRCLVLLGDSAAPDGLPTRRGGNGARPLVGRIEISR
jgi:hypothetical protein